MSLFAIVVCGIIGFQLLSALLSAWSRGPSVSSSVFTFVSVAGCLGVGVWQAAILFKRPPRSPLARVVEGEVRIDVGSEDLSTETWVGEHRVVPPAHWREELRSGQFARVRLAAAPGSPHAVLLAIEHGPSANAEAERGLGAYPHGNPAAPWVLAMCLLMLLFSLPTVFIGFSGTSLGPNDAIAAWKASRQPIVSTSKTADAARTLDEGGQVLLEGASRLPPYLLSSEGLRPPPQTQWVVLHDHARARELQARNNPAFATQTPPVVLEQADVLAYVRQVELDAKPKSRGTGDEVVRWLQKREALRLVKLPGDVATPPSLWSASRTDALAQSVNSALIALLSAVVAVSCAYSWRRTTVLRRRFSQPVPRA